MNEIQPASTNLPATVYKPSELLGIFTSYLSQTDVNRKVIYLRGIYLKNPKHDSRWTSRYDTLRDEDTQTEITLQIPQRLCDNLKDGNLSSSVSFSLHLAVADAPPAPLSVTFFPLMARGV